MRTLKEQIDLSQPTRDFSKKDLENIKESLISSLFRADESEEVMRYSRTLVKADYILKFRYTEE